MPRVLQRDVKKESAGGGGGGGGKRERKKRESGEENEKNLNNFLKNLVPLKNFSLLLLFFLSPPEFFTAK